MDHISLIVKGDKFTAAKVAADRGIPAAFVSEQRSFTVLNCGIDFWREVSDWFNADLGFKGPFAAGSLLLFSYR